jgi:hypothetical protein
MGSSELLAERASLERLNEKPAPKKPEAVNVGDRLPEWARILERLEAEVARESKKKAREVSE